MAPSEKIEHPSVTDKSGSKVSSMFDSIAHRYDLANDVLSFRLHHLWRKKLADRMVPCERVLDLASGTGVLIPYLLPKAKKVVAADFSTGMLAKIPTNLRTDPRVEIRVEDALSMSFAAAEFDCLTIAFGVRNFADLPQGLSEMQRVLRPGGQLLILEFGQIKNPFLAFWYGAYSRYILPVLGSALTGNRLAYEYLPETAASFPSGDLFAEKLQDAGFCEIKSEPLFGGMVYLYSALK